MLLVGFLAEMCLSKGQEDRGLRGPAVLSQSTSATYRRVSASPLHVPASGELLAAATWQGQSGGLLRLDFGAWAGNCSSE